MRNRSRFANFTDSLGSMLDLIPHSVTVAGRRRGHQQSVVSFEVIENPAERAWDGVAQSMCDAYLELTSGLPHPTSGHIGVVGRIGQIGFAGDKPYCPVTIIDVGVDSVEKVDEALNHTLANPVAQ